MRLNIKKSGSRSLFFILQEGIANLIKLIVALVICYIVLGFGAWDGHRGLWHLDNALGVNYFTKSWAAMSGKADDVWEDAIDTTNKNLGEGKREIKQLHKKQQDELDSFDKRTMDDLLENKRK